MFHAVDVSGGEFTHRREVPAEWNELQAHADNLIAQSPEDSRWPDLLPANIAAMHEAVGALDNESLEANRYYGLGVALCYFARRMSDPDTYGKIVRRAAAELHERALMEEDPFKLGMQVSRIGRYSYSENPWDEISRSSVADMSPLERLLVESLYHNQIARDPGKDIDLAGAQARQARGSSLISQSLATNIDAGISTVLKRGLMAKAPEGATDVTVRECIDPEQLGELPRTLHKSSVNLARVRLDEMHALEGGAPHPIKDAVGVDDAGNWTFDRSYLDTAPSADTGKSFHVARLECPAIQVPGLLQLVGRCAADIVRAADEELAQHYRDNDGVAPEPYVDPLDYDYLS
jgi:hypothetical protein